MKRKQLVLLFLTTLVISWSGNSLDALAQGGYVWNGEEGVEYEIGGTNNPPWAVDNSKEGKWVINKTDARFKGNINDNLTIENATLTMPSGWNPGLDKSALTINNGGKLIFVGTGFATWGNSTVNINSGGELYVKGSGSNTADNANTNTTINIDGGLFKVDGNLSLGTHGAIKASVSNGGKITTGDWLRVGHGDNGDKVDDERVLTIGTAGLSTDNSSIDAKNMCIGVNVNGHVILNSGTIATEILRLGENNSATGILEAKGGEIKVTDRIHIQNGTGKIVSQGASFTVNNINLDNGGVLELVLSETGFDKITANNIQLNGALKIDASPLSVIQKFTTSENEALIPLFEATDSLSDIINQASGNWTAKKSGNEVFAATAISGLEYTVNESGLVIPEENQSYGNFVLHGGIDPFQLTLKLDGLADLTQTEALATLLNKTFDNLTATASGVNQLTIGNWSGVLDKALFSYNFDGLLEGSTVSLVSLQGQSVPEPSSWLLAVLGAAFLATIARKRWKQAV